MAPSLCRGTGGRPCVCCAVPVKPVRAVPARCWPRHSVATGLPPRLGARQPRRPGGPRARSTRRPHPAAPVRARRRRPDAVRLGGGCPTPRPPAAPPSATPGTDVGERRPSRCAPDGHDHRCDQAVVVGGPEGRRGRSPRRRSLRGCRRGGDHGRRPRSGGRPGRADERGRAGRGPWPVPGRPGRPRSRRRRRTAPRRVAPRTVVSSRTAVRCQVGARTCSGVVAARPTRTTRTAPPPPPDGTVASPDAARPYSADEQRGPRVCEPDAAVHPLGAGRVPAPRDRGRG